MQNAPLPSVRGTLCRMALCCCACFALRFVRIVYTAHAERQPIMVAIRAICVCPRHAEFPSPGIAAVSTRNISHATWLILPVVIGLSQRLSHACLSTNHLKLKPRMAH